MITKKLFDALNSQVNEEYFSAHSYLAMEAYFTFRNFDGFANFFDVQVQEERAHAKLIFDYIHRMGGEVSLEALSKPETNFSGILDVFKKALDHEKHITGRIYNLMNIAQEEKEHATISFLKWFIDEQVEEEETFDKLIKKLEFIGDNVNAIYMLDTDLGQRAFTPPSVGTLQA